MKLSDQVNKATREIALLVCWDFFPLSMRPIFSGRTDHRESMGLGVHALMCFWGLFMLHLTGKIMRI